MDKQARLEMIRQLAEGKQQVVESTRELADRWAQSFGDLSGHASPETKRVRPSKPKAKTKRSKKKRRK